jgi:cobaltochelatase CobS
MSLENQILEVAKEAVITEMSSDKVSTKIADIAKAKLEEWGIKPSTTTVEIKQHGKEISSAENVHYLFKTVIQCIAAKTPVALVGPAGSFKTSTVQKAAEVLQTPFYSKSVSVQTGTHEFFGYMDATGNYIPTLFREAYENGGVFLLDEFDAGNPNVLAALNQATANGHCPFPDKMVEKHEDFVIFMAGNTYGTGATMEYVGRNKIDAATLDRFVFMQFPYDEKLEMAIAKDSDWCKRVQAYRHKAEEKKVKCIISPRATFYGERLLAAGIDWRQVEEMIIFKGLNQQEIELIRMGDYSPRKKYSDTTPAKGLETASECTPSTPVSNIKSVELKRRAEQGGVEIQEIEVEFV